MMVLELTQRVGQIGKRLQSLNVNLEKVADWSNGDERVCCDF